jgi:hypothetical protein
MFFFVLKISFKSIYHQRNGETKDAISLGHITISENQEFIDKRKKDIHCMLFKITIHKHAFVFVRFVLDNLNKIIFEIPNTIKVNRVM